MKIAEITSVGLSDEHEESDRWILARLEGLDGYCQLAFLLCGEAGSLYISELAKEGFLLGTRNVIVS